MYAQLTLFENDFITNTTKRNNGKIIPLHRTDPIQKKNHQVEYYQKEICRTENLQRDGLQGEVSQSEVNQSEVSQSEVSQSEYNQREMQQKETHKKEVMQEEIWQEKIHSRKSELIQFPGSAKAERKQNYRKGEGQTVFPIKSLDQLSSMGSWLLAHADRKYFLAFTLGINLGLRANELLELKRSDIFFPDGTIRHIAGDCTDTTDRISVFQEKVDKRRFLYLNNSCVRAIQWYYKDTIDLYDDEYIFQSREGGHIQVGTLRKILKDAARACGIKQNIGTHTLRKTFGYFHYQSNHDIVFLQRLFGHSSALITMRYIGIADEEEKRAYHEVSIDLLGDI